MKFPVSTPVHWFGIPLLFLVIGLLLSAPSHADYLSDLEAEAKTMDEPVPAVETEKPNWTPQGQQISDKLKSGLNQSGFEENLKYNFIGSYTFYTRLHKDDKAKVYEAYKERNDIEEIKNLINDLYKRI